MRGNRRSDVARLAGVPVQSVRPATVDELRRAYADRAASVVVEVATQEPASYWRAGGRYYLDDPEYGPVVAIDDLDYDPDLGLVIRDAREQQAPPAKHRPDPVLHHVTSNTGHVARTARSEVGDDVVAMLRPIVKADGGWLPGALAWYLDVWRALAPETHKHIGGAAAYQVAGGPHDTPAGKAPFVLCVGCWREDASESAWRQAHEAADLLARAAPGQSGYANRLPTQAPPVPWLSATVYPMAELVGDKLTMLGDLERCVFWTLAEGEQAP